MQGTLLGKRWQEGLVTIGGGIGDNSSLTRLALIKEGLGVIASNPVMGIGLNNAITVLGKYAHNDYIELFVSTGLLGGFLYYSIFLVWWLKLLRIGKFEIDHNAKDIIALSKTFIVITLISNLLTVSYYDKALWIFQAILIGWAYHKEIQLKFEQEMHYYSLNELGCQA
jgi:O-antigen ligase